MSQRGRAFRDTRVRRPLRQGRVALLLVLLVGTAARASAPPPEGGLTPDHLEHLLELPRFQLPLAFPEDVVRKGPIRRIFPTAGGVMVVENHAVLCLDASGHRRWRVGFPYGLRRVVSSWDGSWLAGTTTRIHRDLRRETADWLLEGRQGKLRVLARDVHPMGERRVDRVLVPYSPVPFAPVEGEGESEEPFAATTGPEEILPERLPAPPKLGYRGRRTGDVFLEEGLFVLRSTFFTRTEKSWWSLHHYDPLTGAALKLSDGVRRLDRAALESFRPHPLHQDRFLLEQDGRSFELDPIAGRFRPCEDHPNPRPRPGVTLLEVFHLQSGGPDGGVVLIHPEGRLRLALAGRTVEELVRVPETGVVFALSVDRKRSVISDERHRRLFRLDLTEVDENLAAHRRTRDFQERINRCVDRVEGLIDAPLDEAHAALTWIEEELAGGSPTDEQNRQATDLQVRARAILAPRLRRAGQVDGARRLLSGCETPDLARQLLHLDLRHRRSSLAEDLEQVMERLHDYEDTFSLEPVLIEALAVAGRSREAMELFDRRSRGVSRSQPLAALAVRVGDAATRRGEHDRAAVAYRRALELKPSSEGAALKLARALARDDRPCEALPALSRLVPEDREGAVDGVRARVVRLALECRDLYRARHVLDGLRIDRPLEPTYLEWDADLLIEEGHPDRARPKLQALLRLRPDSERLRVKLRRLEEER